MDALRSGHTEVLDADLSKYFDTIPHRQLLRAAAGRISGGSVLRLLKQWLRAPVVEEDNWRRGKSGRYNYPHVEPSERQEPATLTRRGAR